MIITYFLVEQSGTFKDSVKVREKFPFCLNRAEQPAVHGGVWSRDKARTCNEQEMAKYNEAASCILSNTLSFN